ncbi:MAG: glycosyl hydrolase-related protein [Candidatus Binataceae bacterium]
MSAREAISDASFGFVRRPLRASEPAGTEDICPTAPHRTVTAIEGEQIAVAMMSRGIYEVEARPEGAGTTLLLTLLRCVGWLSRSDLATRRGGAGPELKTPGAQERGEHSFEFAFATARGRFADGDLAQRAQAYAYPPRLFQARNNRQELFAMRCDSPHVLLSTARPSGRPGRFTVRAYSATDESVTAKFEFMPATQVRRVNLAGRRVALQGRRPGRAVELKLRPFEIVTFEVERSS